MRHSSITTLMCHYMVTSRQSERTNMEQSTFLWEEHPANHSASPDSEAEWMMIVATCPSNFLGLLNERLPSGWYGKTYPASCHRTEDGTLVPSSGRWQNSGMGSPTEHLTLSTLVSHNAASVCSLSDILEIGGVPQRYFLSAKACAGILRRAEKRGKKLLPLLQLALHSVVQETSE